MIILTEGRVIALIYVHQSGCSKEDTLNTIVTVQTGVNRNTVTM